jgi:hypothetical protein
MRDLSMRLLKSIAALASAAAITFVFGWVGLALLGF